MAKSALIEELEKQFNENPRRVFARLANEYRKSGDLELAIDICRTHIPQQPGYISGYIVLGQALFETQQLEEAKSTFETALGLDPENLIALRQLGDIARVSGDGETARAWYQRLLEVDPQNEEAAAQLAALPVAIPESTPQPRAGSAVDEFGWREINPVDPTSLPEPDSADATPSWLDGDRAVTPVATDAVAEHEPLELPSLAELEPPAAAEESSSMPDLEPEPARETDTVEPTIALVTDEPPALELVDVAENETLDETSEPPSEIPATFVTETMAELYHQQGFTSEALEIYRQLAEQRPDDDGLRRKIESLEERAAAAEPAEAVPDLPPAAQDSGVHAESTPTIREFLSRIAGMRLSSGAARPTSEPAPREAGERETPSASAAIDEEVDAAGAPSVDPPAHESSSEPAVFDFDAADLFPHARVSESDEAAARALASAFPDDFLIDIEPAAGQPARQAPDELSLDDVFRDSASGREPRKNGAVSFDEFFGSDTGEASPEPSSEEAPERKGSDIETFHAWLEGLKK